MHTDIPAAASARYVQGVRCLLSSPCRGPKTRKHKTQLSGEQGQNTKTQNTRPAGWLKHQNTERQNTGGRQMCGERGGGASQRHN